MKTCPYPTGLFADGLSLGPPGGRPLGVVDVREFGAAGDGVADDTTALQAALDAAAQGVTVLLPPGTYRTGILAIDRSLRLHGQGATLVGTDAAILAVTAPLDALELVGLAFDFPGANGVSGREAFVNASTQAGATVDDFGEALTEYNQYATVNAVGRLVIRDCAFGAAKVTCVGSPVWVERCTWEHESGVSAAPYYLLLANAPGARVLNNRFRVHPPAGSNKDVIKVTDLARSEENTEGVLTAHNYLHSLNASCTCAQIDTYTGGRRLRIAHNHLVNVQAHVKAWGSASGGSEMDTVSVDGNVFVREDGFQLLAEVQCFIYAINTRLGVRGNDFIDLSPTTASMTCIALRRSDGTDFDAVATNHSKAIAIVGNVASFVRGNNASGVFIRWNASDDQDPRGDLTVAANVMNGGAGWFRVSSGAVRPTFTTWVGNVHNDPTTSEELQVGRPVYSVGNVWRSVVDRGLRALALELDSGDNDDVNLLDVETAYLTPHAEDSVLTGVLAVSAHVRNRIRIVNPGTASLTLAHEDSASAAANRLLSPTGSDIVLPQDGVAEIEYDHTAQRWRIVSALFDTGA